MAEKRTLPARKVAEDIKSGLSNADLRKKYQLTEKGLESLSVKLVEAGLLEQSDIESRKPPVLDDSGSTAADSFPLPSAPLFEEVATDAKAPLTEEKPVAHQDRYEEGLLQAEPSLVSSMLRSKWLKIVGCVLAVIFVILVSTVSYYKGMRASGRGEELIKLREDLLSTANEENRKLLAELKELKQQTEKDKKDTDQQFTEKKEEIRGLNEILAKRDARLQGIAKEKKGLEQEIARLKATGSQSQQVAPQAPVSRSLTNELLEASRAGRFSDILNLLNEGADPNAKTQDGWTALMLACYEGHKNVVGLLLACGARIQDKANNGATALKVAQQQRRTNVVQILVGYGAKQ